MDSRLLLVNGITLLYRQSQQTQVSEKSTALVRSLINSIKLPEQQLTIDPEVTLLEGLMQQALSMCEDPLDHQYSETELLQRIKVIVGHDAALYDAFQAGITGTMPDNDLKQFCLNLERSLNNYFRDQRTAEILNKASSTMRFKRNEIQDMKAFVASVVAELEPYQIDHAAKDPAVLDEMDFNDETKVAEIYGRVQAQQSGQTILQTGYQCINRMLDGGFRRGETWVIGALQHQWKSGFSLTIFRQLAMYNKPVLKDPTKKALMVRISFEDPLTNNFEFLYSSFKQLETGVVPSKDEFTALPPLEAARYVKSKLHVEGGYETYFMGVNPSLWTYRDIQNKILSLEAMGYEIHVVMLDYLLKVPTTGCDQGPYGIDIRNLYERLRNFFSARNILFITPHQLSTEAKVNRRDGELDFVKGLVDNGYYAGCKQIDQVVDGELFTQIEFEGGKKISPAWLTVQRGKHRKVAQTPGEFLFACLPFTKDGIILDDIYGPDSSSKRVGGKPMSEGGGSSWWQTTGDDDVLGVAKPAPAAVLDEFLIAA